jgi:hypothetical protein
MADLDGTASATRRYEKNINVARDVSVGKHEVISFRN